MPFFKDLYDEQIPEMSSDREASSFHTKRFLRQSGKSGNVYDDDMLDSSRDSDLIIGSIRQTNLRKSDMTKKTFNEVRN